MRSVTALETRATIQGRTECQRAASADCVAIVVFERTYISRISTIRVRSEYLALRLSRRSRATVSELRTSVGVRKSFRYTRSPVQPQRELHVKWPARTEQKRGIVLTVALPPFPERVLLERRGKMMHAP